MSVCEGFLGAVQGLAAERLESPALGVIVARAFVTVSSLVRGSPAGQGRLEPRDRGGNWPVPRDSFLRLISFLPFLFLFIGTLVTRW